MSVHELTIQLVPIFAKHAVIRTLPLNHSALHTSDTHGHSDGFVIWPFFFPLGLLLGHHVTLVNMAMPALSKLLICSWFICIVLDLDFWTQRIARIKARVPQSLKS